MERSVLWGEAQNLFQLLSFLLQYPGEEWRGDLAAVRDEISQLQAAGNWADIVPLLQTFLQAMDAMGMEAWEENYVRQFDFAPKTPLYLTYLRYGDARERGAELVRLKHYYEEEGLWLQGEELPDYLPLMLEFAASAQEEKAIPLLREYQPFLAALHQKLVEVESPYRWLLAALLNLLERYGHGAVPRTGSRREDRELYGLEEGRA